MPAWQEVFGCPVCRGTEVTVATDELVCGGCGRRFPVVGEIPRLLVDGVAGGQAQVQRVFDFEHRRYRDSWYTRFEPRLVDLFLADCELPAEYFRGRRVLDAGCGSGRWTYALAELGADVAAFDLTEGGLEAAHAELGGADGPLLCQANLFSPPFRPASFDFVMSWGVLHHTPDTRRAFESVAPLVRPGGQLYVMIYERYGLRRRLGTDALRAVLRRLSDERRYRFCRRLVIRSRFVAAGLGPFVTVAFYDPATSPVDPQTLQFGLFDAYSPRYNHLHTRDEVVEWFRASGFADVTVLDTPPQSTIKVRGTRT